MNTQTKTHQNDVLVFSLIILLPILCAIFSLGLGKYPISPIDVIKIIWGKLIGQQFIGNPIAASMVWEIRFPRILAAMLTGAGLAVSGAAFQGVFRNPIASPYTLGVSNGASFGAVLSILLVNQAAINQISAMLFSLLSVGLTFLLSIRARNSTVTLVLAGVVVGNLFSALVSLLKFLADPLEKLPSIVFWLMGSLSGANYAAIFRFLWLYCIASGLLIALRWRINLLSMGDAEAKSFGVDVRFYRTLLIVCCSALTAISVSIAGVVGWVGLVIPHIARMVVGPDYRRLIPASFSLGASYLLLIDDLCRTISSVEIPLGVVTALLGTPIFIYFLFKEKANW